VYEAKAVGVRIVEIVDSKLAKIFRVQGPPMSHDMSTTPSSLLFPDES